MDKKLFVCLANSKKYNERCIAGIELQESEDGTYSVCLCNNNNRWIRPVSHCEHGEISSTEANKINILDIVEISITDNCPKGYQSENVHYSRMDVTGKIELSNSNLDCLIDKKQTLIFGNHGKAVIHDKIGSVDYSLMLIKPKNLRIFEKTAPYLDEVQLRGKFLFKNNNYDLPITDIDFKEKYCQGNDIDKDNVYLTISLGMQWGGWHSKLIAGVILTGG